MRSALILIAMAAATQALADEASIKLKPGPGMEATASYCSACHSLDYPQMNAPFLDARGWDGVVDKMVKSFGAPIPPDEAKAIKAYLAGAYGKAP